MNCASYKYWDAERIGRGDCRRNAPHLSADTTGKSVSWPRTNATDWCGEYVSRPVDPNGPGYNPIHIVGIDGSGEEVCCIVPACPEHPWVFGDDIELVWDKGNPKPNGN